MKAISVFLASILFVLLIGLASQSEVSAQSPTPGTPEVTGTPQVTGTPVGTPVATLVAPTASPGAPVTGVGSDDGGGYTVWYVTAVLAAIGIGLGSIAVWTKRRTS